jgi:hypothetical protein
MATNLEGSQDDLVLLARKPENCTGHRPLATTPMMREMTTEDPHSS